MVNCIHIGQYKGEVKVYCASGQEEYRPYYECALHGRCVPKISGRASQVWEQREERLMMKWCHTCPDKTPPAQGT